MLVLPEVAHIEFQFSSYEGVDFYKLSLYRGCNVSLIVLVVLVNLNLSWREVFIVMSVADAISIFLYVLSVAPALHNVLLPRFFS